MGKARYWLILGFLAGLLHSSSPRQFVDASTAVSAPLNLPKSVNEVDENKYFINLDSIAYVDCETVSGTASVVSRDVVITAYHVVRGQVEGSAKCKIGPSPAEVIFASKLLDFAIMSANTGEAQRYAIDCKGFKNGQTYFAIGFPKQGFVVTKLTATGIKSNQSAMDGTNPLDSLTIMKGAVYHGMSGGPIIDGRGVQVGTIIATTEDNNFAAARQLLDTPLCAKHQKVRQSR